jgi:hypothetical protein
MAKKEKKMNLRPIGAWDIDPSRQSYTWMYPKPAQVGKWFGVGDTSVGKITKSKQITQEDVAIGVCYDNRKDRFLTTEEAKALKIKVATNQDKYDIYR